MLLSVQKFEDILKEYLNTECPITFKNVFELKEPARIINDKSHILYEFEAINHWINTHHTNPLTREEITPDNIQILNPNLYNIYIAVLLHSYLFNQEIFNSTSNLINQFRSWILSDDFSSDKVEKIFRDVSNFVKKNLSEMESLLLSNNKQSYEIHLKKYSLIEFLSIKEAFTQDKYIYKNITVSYKDFVKNRNFFIQNKLNQNFHHKINLLFVDEKNTRSAEVQNKIGDCYFWGNNVKQNYYAAMNWYSKAAEQGLAKAQLNLGICCYKLGFHMMAYDAYVRAAKQGLPAAQNSLAIFYLNGIGGIKKNYYQAFKLFELAAKQNSAIAKSNLGYCYLNGFGVEKNFSFAVSLFAEAARKGNNTAKENLIYCHKALLNYQQYAIKNNKKLLTNLHLRKKVSLKKINLAIKHLQDILQDLKISFCTKYQNKPEKPLNYEIFIGEIKSSDFTPILHPHPPKNAVSTILSL